jgi:hypothetical protein
MRGSVKDDTILFNPVGVVHDRNIGMFKEALQNYEVRRIYNTSHAWFSNFRANGRDVYCFRGGRVPPEAFDGVAAVVLFSAQPRFAPLNLIEEAAFRKIPVIAIQEVYQMMLEQGVVNEYFVPVDRLFVGSDYERQGFIDFGLPAEAVETTGGAFRFCRRSSPPDPEQVKRLKAVHGIAPHARVATLSLAYLTPSGETHEVRRKLLEIVAAGLPPAYELMVKPHPAEKDAHIAAFVKRYAPRAHVADCTEPIDTVLDITDVLFNRGASQVTLDALERKIPVVVVPTGRRTFFHGVVDRAIVNEGADIPRALAAIKEEGMALYGEISRRYFSITPREAFERTCARIEEIAQKKELFSPDARLAETVLFWAWTGSGIRSMRLLTRLKRLSKIEEECAARIERLIACKADRRDIDSLRAWARRGYREWIVQSLWIKELYLRGGEFTHVDAQWLAGYPPKMNREYFVSFACMLGWCYMRAGMHQECDSLMRELYDEYKGLPDMEYLMRSMRRRDPYLRHAAHWLGRARCSLKALLRDVAVELRGH